MAFSIPILSMTSMISVGNKEKRVEALRVWCDGLLAKFRVEAQKLSELERVSVSRTLDNYLPPCQIEVIWIEEPEFQTVIISNFADRNDGEIIINGPYKAYEVIDAIDALLTQPRWSRVLRRDSFVHYAVPYLEQAVSVSIADLLGIILEQHLEYVRNSVLLNPRKPAKLQGHRVSNECSAWLIAGNIADLDQVQIVNFAINQAKSQAAMEAAPATPATSIQESPRPAGTATYFYPPITIGPVPKPDSFKELLNESFMRALSEKAFDAKFGDFQIIFTKDGLMALTEARKDVSVRIFNTIFGVSLLNGIPTKAVRESEIGVVGLDPSTMQFTLSSMPLFSLRTFPILERWPSRSTHYLRRRAVSQDELSHILGRAERIYRDQEKSELLIFLLEAYTHLEDTEYAEAFTLAWIVIERHLAQQWKDFLRDKKIAGGRKHKLTDHVFWSTDHVIEVLSLGGTMDVERYRLLMELKKEAERIHP